MFDKFTASVREALFGKNPITSAPFEGKATSPSPSRQRRGEKPWFGSKHAPWAIRADRIESHPENARFKGEFLDMCDGSINLNTHSWAIAKYYFDASTPRTSGLDIGHPDWCNLTNETRIPWHPDWKHATDGDSYTTLVEKETGLCYLIWQTRYDGAANIMRCGAANVVMAGFRPHGGPVADIWTKSNGYQPSRAAGIALPHMLVTREEIDAGHINHCLALVLLKPSRGAPGGEYRMAPATKTIHRTGALGTGRLMTGVRIAFDGLSQLEIDLWSEQFSDDVRPHMLTIARAVRDYGFLLVDNGGREKRGAVYFENNITANWDELGLNEDITTFALHSLLQPNVREARILAEPVFPGGDLNRTARYAGISYPAELF